MKEAIESAIKALAEQTEKVTANSSCLTAMQLSQAALNLSHVLATLDNLKK
jgi:hypothetical protein